jgi:acetyl esterase/lipase
LLTTVFCRYGSRQFTLDLFTPGDAGPAWPVIMQMPVGGWRSCGRAETEPWLVAHGFAVAVVECRVVPEVTAPATIHDCKAGLRWLRAHAAELGLDGGRIATMGRSAGGHLSALMAVSAGVEALEGDGGNAGISTAVQAAVDQCGPTDLERMADPALAAASPVLEEVTSNFVGGPVGDRRDLARLMSPITHVSAGCPPVLIIHGEDDPIVPVEESILFHRALAAAGVDVDLHRLSGQEHGLPTELTQPTVLAFLRRVLG